MRTWKGVREATMTMYQPVTTARPRVNYPASAPPRLLSRGSVKFPNEAVALRVLGREAILTEEERDLVRRLSVFRGTVQAGRAFWRDGEPVSARVIISGWACRQRSLPDGRRQIFGFLIPGDTVGVCTETRPLDEVSTVAVTRVECMDALLLREILSVHDPRHARLGSALAATRRHEEACLLDHIVRLGRQSALERSAHLFLELRERCAAAGLADGARFPMPLTQEVLSDALGLSIVHLNRTLQQMKRDGLIEHRSGWMTILDTARMKTISDFGQHDV